MPDQIESIEGEALATRHQLPRQSYARLSKPTTGSQRPRSREKCRRERQAGDHWSAIEPFLPAHLNKADGLQRQIEA